MVARLFDPIVTRIFASEGGYCNDAHDPGGPTKYGITIIDVRKYLKPDAKASDVKALTTDQAKSIYREHYWRPVRGAELAAGLDYSVMDYGVNSGVGRAGRVLRRLCDLPTDTHAITPEVVAAAARRDAKALIRAMNSERLQFLQGLSTWKYFGKGWGSRVSRVRTDSLSFAADNVAGLSAAGDVPEEPAAKGVVPASKVPATVAKGTAGGSAGASYPLWDWITGHPIETAALVALAVVAIGLLYVIFEQRRQKKQNFIPAHIQPLPEVATDQGTLL